MSSSTDEILRALNPPPPVRNGWWLLSWRKFHDQLEALVAEVRELRARDPHGYGSHPKSKLLATIIRHVTVEIPSDPAHPDYRQGKSLGEGYSSWFRAKFHERYRLFFRYRSADKVIVYVWVNTEGGLRKSGDRNDPYNVFRRMLQRGAPPTDFDDLLRECKALRLAPDRETDPN